MAEIPQEIIKAMKCLDEMGKRKQDHSAVGQIQFGFDYVHIFIDMYNDVYDKAYSAGYEAGVKKLDEKDFN